MFSVRLKELRKETTNLTQTDMAKFLGVAKTTYASYEQGKRMPDADLQNKLADFFDVSLDYLHGRTDLKDSAKIATIQDHSHGGKSLSPKQMNSKAQTIAAHIDSDVSDEDMKEILSFIDYIKKRDHSGN